MTSLSRPLHWASRDGRHLAWLAAVRSRTRAMCSGAGLGDVQGQFVSNESITFSGAATLYGNAAALDFLKPEKHKPSENASRTSKNVEHRPKP